MTRLRLLPLLLVVLLQGCIAQIAYTPNDAMLEQLGPDAAEEEFAKVLKRSRTPEVREVTVELDNYTYKWRGQAGPAGVYAHDGDRAIYFRNITRVDIYENFRVFVFNNDLLLADYLFTSLGDGQRFADLVWSFKTRHASGGD
jgi:hypothetical protein